MSNKRKFLSRLQSHDDEYRDVQKPRTSNHQTQGHVNIGAGLRSVLTPKQVNGGMNYDFA